MDLSSILTEDEMSSISAEVLGKLECAYRTELAAAVEAESAKTTKRFNKMLDCVQKTAEDKINKAVAESVKKANVNAINDKMYNVLQGITAIIEGAGIPTSENTKKLQEELNQCNVNLKKAYAEREHVKQQLNDNEKKCYIYQLVQGMKPSVVDAVMKHFINFDIREIDRDTITKFIDGNSNDLHMRDVDPDFDGELNMDKINTALGEISHDLELDVPTLPSQKKKKDEEKEQSEKKGRFESLTKGLSPERVALGTPNVSFEALNNMCNPIVEDEDASDAIAQFNELTKFGAFI